MPFSVLTLPLKKNLCVSSCKVCGKCIPVRVSLYLHHTGNRHNLRTPRFIVPLVRLSCSTLPPPYPYCRAHLNCSLHHQHLTRPFAELPFPYLYCRAHSNYSLHHQHPTRPPVELLLPFSYYRAHLNCSLHKHSLTRPLSEPPLLYPYRRAHLNFSLHH